MRNFRNIKIYFGAFGLILNFLYWERSYLAVKSVISI